MEKIDLNFNNNFEIELKKAGYKIFKDNWKNSLRGFQKRFVDDIGIKYFLTGYHYNFGKQIPNQNLPDIDTYSFDTQFTIKDGKTINIDFHMDFLKNPYSNLKEMEEFFENTWKNMNANYYELYT